MDGVEDLGRLLSHPGLSRDWVGVPPNWNSPFGATSLDVITDLLSMRGLGCPGPERRSYPLVGNTGVWGGRIFPIRKV